MAMRKQFDLNLIILISLALLPAAATGSMLYKWIDEDGQVRYSDTLPAEQKKKRHQRLDQTGRILETTEASKSPEQIQRERAEAALRQEQERIEAERLARIKAEKEHRDRVLLMTFTSEEEMVRAEEERVAVIDSVISLLNKNIEQEIETIERLETRARIQYVDKDKPIPGGLAQNIEYFNEKLLNKQRQLQLKMEEKERVKRRFAEDILRYRELTSGTENTE